MSARRQARGQDRWQLEPDELIFSAWGLREGLLYQRLEPVAQRQDPLLAGVATFVGQRGVSIARAAMIAGWTADAASSPNRESERLRLAATGQGPEQLWRPPQDGHPAGQHTTGAEAALDTSLHGLLDGVQPRQHVFFTQPCRLVVHDQLRDAQAIVRGRAQQ